MALADLTATDWAGVKKQFSNILLNFSRNGKRLSSLEKKLLSVFFDHVPAEIQGMLMQQFRSYNLL